ncbi:MAP7 domain-containing protein 3 [Meriones unguiculatus]|uniref:MAP7 domain-containing protein 3 n=1 Tax=Meriones unguiculatus TaxID=10047 RepID=UPI00293F4AE5|nr:MAP7 domain-containing protein 3 [Meriones unguiculatus]
MEKHSKCINETINAVNNQICVRGILAVRLHKVAVAEDLAKERRHKHGINSSAVMTRRSSYTPGCSVLKNDIKQQLAKERREEQKRQQDANKERHLMEKEQKSKLHYEKQLEKKQCKLREQKEKGEQRRVSAEQKRKQKQAEEKKRFKAVVSRTMERCKHFDQHRKSKSQESGAINTNTYAKMQVAAKLAITPTMKAEIPLKEDVKEPAKVKREIPPKENMELSYLAKIAGLSKAHVEVILQKMKDISEVKVDSSPKVNIEEPSDVNITRHPTSNVDQLPMVNVDASLSARPSPVVSEDSSLSMGSSSALSVEISPAVNMDTSPEASINTSTELSTDSASVEVASAGSTALQSSGEQRFEASVEGQPEASAETSPKNPEMDKKKVDCAIKKQPSCLILCYKWPSTPLLGCYPPSPLKTITQNQIIHPPSHPEVSTKLSTKPPLSYKITPFQNILCMPKSFGMIKKNENIQNHLIKTESGDKKKTSNEAAIKAFLEIHRTIYEQNTNKETENFIKETKQRNSEHMAEKGYESPAKKFSLHEDMQQEKDLTKRYFGSQENQKKQLQKGDSAMMKSQDRAEDRKRENKKLMLKNLQERLERRKFLELFNNRISKEDEAKDEGETNDKESPEMFPSGLFVPHGCTREQTVILPKRGWVEAVWQRPPSYHTRIRGTKTSSMKLKKFHKNANKRRQMLAFLKAGSSETNTKKKKILEGYPLKKLPTSCPVKSRKMREASTAIQSPLSVTNNQEWISDETVDFKYATETPIIRTASGSNKQNSKDSVTSCPGFKLSLERKDRGKPVFAHLAKAFSHLDLAGQANNLENPFAYRRSKMPFGGEEEGGESVGMIYQIFPIS